MTESTRGPMPMTMPASYDEPRVPVRGGELAIGRWAGGPDVVIAAHGITGNHRSWAAVAAALDGAVTLVAPDLRGRAASRDLPGPYGMATHADDCAAVLDHLGVDEALWVGHSMGGFVIAMAAERHADRVRSLVAVDGGLPIPVPVPSDADVEELVGSVIGPALDRLDMSWPSVDDYLGFFQAHPAFAPPNELNEYAAETFRYDAVVGGDGRVRSSVSKDAVLEDGGAIITQPSSVSALTRIKSPTTFLWAPRGLLDQTPGLYPPELVASSADELAHLDPVEVPDVNHYTIVFSAHGASAVADAIRAAVARAE
jgi:lipase